MSQPPHDSSARNEAGIRAGDTVRLKSGGPPMTVQVLSQNLAYCAWFKEGERHSGTFEVSLLEALPPAPPP